MSWTHLLLVFVLCHATGDYLLQTEFQAAHKTGGLGRDPVRRRALVTHVVTYTAAFAPALVWIGGARVIWVAAAILVPHLLVDDGRGLRWYLRAVKGVPGEPPPSLLMGVDQTVHLLCLAAVAALVVR